MAVDARTTTRLLGYRTCVLGLESHGSEHSQQNRTLLSRGLEWLGDDGRRTAVPGGGFYGDSWLIRTSWATTTLTTAGVGLQVRPVGWNQPATRCWYCGRAAHCPPAFRCGCDWQSPCCLTACVQEAAGIAAIQWCTVLPGKRRSVPRFGRFLH